MYVNKMVPSKSKRSESRRSSILKPRKPRQPLQNVNFDSSSNENSPTTSKVKRRVSFAEKKHVKEFCHSTEQGTVWDNTYEEHDFSLKGSFVVDQNVEVESKENTSLHASNNACIYVHSESNSCYPNNIYLVNNQLLQDSIARANEENNDIKCDLDFTNPVKSTETSLSNISQLECATLSNKSCVTKDTLSNGIVAYSDSDEECMELLDEEYQSRQTVITNISKKVKLNNMICRDSNEKDYVDNVAKYSESCSNNINSELDKTCVQDLSMELTTPISASLLSSHLHAKEQNKQKHDKSLNNLDTNYTINRNNISIEITEAVPICAKYVASNSGIPKEIPAILKNCENIKWDAANTHDMIFSTNLQSNIISEDISEHTLDMNCTNDSMILTSVIQPFTDVTGICCTNNTAFDTSMEIIESPKMFKKMANNENIIEINVLKKDQIEKSEIFNDVLMEMTKPMDTMFSNVSNNKENFRVNEPISRDDRTMFFHNVSMEMTKTVSTKSKQEIIDTISCKSISEENAHSRKDINIPTCFNEGTKILCKSMEFTEIIPGHHERMLHTAHVAQSNKDTCENHKNDKTKFFNDASMEIMESVNIVPLNIDEKNLKIDKSISRDNKTILFHNVSMEMTTAVSSRNRKKITQPIICESIFKENTHGEKYTNNSIYFNEGTKLLCKSMEFTEVVPISLQDERTFNSTNTIHTTQSTSFSQTLSKNISLPAENSMGIALQIDAIANETIQDISKEIIAAAPSTLHLTQDVKINKEENLIISKNDGFQHLMKNNNNLTKSRENVTRENFTTSREIVETENIRHDELSNIFAIQSPLDNLDHSLNANLESASIKKRVSPDENQGYSRRVCDSFMKAQSFQENDVHLFSSANSVNDTDRNECFVQNIIDHTQVSDSNLKDSLNEISEYSFLRKSLPYLENSLVELQSIKPPSFVCLDSEGENSFCEIQHELQSSTITEIPVNDTSNRLIINNIIKFKSPINLRENVTNNDFTILKEKKELINTENNQAEDCHKSTIIDKTEDEQEINCQAVTRTIINDNRLNKSNYYTIKNINEEINEEKVLSMNAKDGKTVTVQDINHCTSLIIKEIEIRDEVDERECIQKRINEDATLQNKIKEKGHYSDKKRQETEKCSDHLEGIGAVIKDQADPEEHRKNLNDEEQQQSMKQKDACAEGLVIAQYGSTIEDIKNESLIEQDPFLTLLQKLETQAAREDCIWNIYYKDIDKKMIVFGFISNSLLIATFLSFDFNSSGENLIKEVKIISRISDDAGVLIRIVHKLILEKVNTETLTNLYRIYQDIFPMLNFISQDVKLAMDFMFDLKRLDDLNLMEIAHDEISFVSQSKRMDIILKVTIKIKRFDKLIPNDINLRCLLGRIKETDIKNLIKNVKKDHKFLRRYMNDVKDYIDIMEETSK